MTAKPGTNTPAERASTGLDMQSLPLFGFCAYVTDVAESRTVTPEDNGTVLRSTGSAITLTFPRTLPVGFNCAILQAGAGQVTAAAGTSANIRSSNAYTKTAAQWSLIGILCDTTGNFILAGDGAT